LAENPAPTRKTISETPAKKAVRQGRKKIRDRVQDKTNVREHKKGRETQQSSSEKKVTKSEFGGWRNKKLPKKNSLNPRPKIGKRKRDKTKES